MRNRITGQKFRCAGRASPAPWLSLWESWRAISEPERAQAAAGLHIGALIAAGYPLSYDPHPPSNRVTPNGVGQLPESQTRHSQRVQPALSVMTLFPYLLLRTPSQSRLSAVPALPKGEPRGGRCPPSKKIMKKSTGTTGKNPQFPENKRSNQNEFSVSRPEGPAG